MHRLDTAFGDRRSIDSLSIVPSFRRSLRSLERAVAQIPGCLPQGSCRTAQITRLRGYRCISISPRICCELYRRIEERNAYSTGRFGLKARRIERSDWGGLGTASRLTASLHVSCNSSENSYYLIEWQGLGKNAHIKSKQTPLVDWKAVFQPQ